MGLMLLQFLWNENSNDYNVATFLPQTSDYPSELETEKTAEKTHSKNKTSQHFIKKNVEVSIKA